MILTLTAGTMFLVWLGEIITEKGVGNGMSLLIFAGIIARLPGSIGQSFVSGTSFLGLIFLGVIGLGMVASIIFINEGQRRIMVQYAKRIRGNRVFGGTTTYIPLKVNSSGMIPLIFAMSIMLIPGTIATYFTAAETEWVKSTAQFIARVFSSTGVVYWVLYFWLVVAFTYFYTAVVFQQQNLPETLQKQGGFIPGIRAGRPTADYLNRVVNRITLLGAIFPAMAILCTRSRHSWWPTRFWSFWHNSRWQVPRDPISQKSPAQLQPTAYQPAQPQLLRHRPLGRADHSR
jgi:preprotein translocase subunit SecY